MESKDPKEQTELSRREFFGAAAKNSIATKVAIDATVISLKTAALGALLSGCEKKQTEDEPEKERTIEKEIIKPPSVAYSKKTTFEKPTVPNEVDDRTIEELSNNLVKALIEYFNKLKQSSDKSDYNQDFIKKHIAPLYQIFKKTVFDKIPGYEKFLLQKGVNGSDVWRVVNEFLIPKGYYLYLDLGRLDLYKITESQEATVDNQYKSSMYTLDRGMLDFAGDFEMGRAWHNRSNTVLMWPHQVNASTKAGLSMLKIFGASNPGGSIVYKQFLEDTKYHEAIHAYLVQRYKRFGKIKTGVDKLINNGEKPKNIDENAIQRLQQLADLLLSIDELCAFGASISQSQNILAAVQTLLTKDKFYQKAQQAFKEGAFKKMQSDKRFNRTKYKSTEQNVDAIEMHTYLMILYKKNPTEAISVMNEIGVKMYNQGIHLIEGLEKSK